EQKHHKHDADRFYQVESEGVGRDDDRLGLEVDFADLDSNRLIALQILQLLPYSVTYGHDVAALHRRNPQPNSRLAVELEQPSRRLLVAALQRGNISKQELPAGTIRSDRQIQHLFCRLKTAGWI